MVRNDVITKHNERQWKSANFEGTKQNIYYSKGFEDSCSKMYSLLNLSHCVERYGHLCQIYQNHSPDMVMSCDPAFNFQNFLFLSNSI